jgi:GH25 family lysozyme M1 (1,4-beta-N-acetylmuramidase)
LFAPRLTSALAIAAVLACGSLTACSSTAGASPARDHAGIAVAPMDKAAQPASAPAGVHGLDASAWQKAINWKSAKAKGAQFAIVKATEGVTYQDSYFAQQYNGARAAGLAHGAYHFATPNTTSGSRQADYFIAHGGAAKPDGHTFPGVLDIEDNPYGGKCYGMGHAKMVAWIHAFINEYHTRTGRWPIINTFTEWWKSCTGNSTVFAAKDPLWINNHKSTATPLPAGWHTYTIWQWAEAGPLPGDQNVIKAGLYKALLPEKH